MGITIVTVVVVIIMSFINFIIDLRLYYYWTVTTLQKAFFNHSNIVFGFHPIPPFKYSFIHL